MEVKQPATEEVISATPGEKVTPKFTPESVARGKKFYEEHGEELKEFDTSLREAMKKKGVTATF